MKLTQPTSKAHLKLTEPKKNLSKLSIFVEDHLGIPNILDILKNLQNISVEA